MRQYNEEERFPREAHHHRTSVEGIFAFAGSSGGEIVAMPRTCSICSHPARENIDSELVRRESYRNIAERFSVSEAALSRHLNEHLAEYVQEALREYGLDKGVKVLSKLSGIIERLDNFLDAAEAHNDAREFVVVAAELRKELELLAKLQGVLAQEGAVNVTVTQEWTLIETALSEALESYPEARRAVARKLWAIEGSKNGTA